MGHSKEETNNDLWKAVKVNKAAAAECCKSAAAKALAFIFKYSYIYVKGLLQYLTRTITSNSTKAVWNLEIEWKVA